VNKHSAAVVATGASILATAVAALVTARSLKPIEYGQYAVIVVCVSLATLIVVLGTNQALRVLIEQEGNIGIARTYITMSLAMSLLASGVSLLALVAVYLVNPSLTPEGGWPIVVVGVAATAVVGGQLADLTMAVVGVVVGIAIQAVSGLVQLILLMIIIGWWGLSLNLALGSMIAAESVQVVVVVELLRRTHLWPGFGWDQEHFRRLFGFGARGSGMTIGLLIVWRLDRLILGLLCGPSAVGCYSVAASVAEGLRLIPQGVGQVMLQDVARVGAFDARSRMARRRVLALVTVGSVLVFAFADQIVMTLFGPSFEAAAWPLRILCLGETAMAALSIDSRILLALHREKFVGRVGLFAAALAVPTYLLGARGYGINGVAVGSVGVYLAIESCLWLTLKRISRGLRPGHKL